MEYKNLAAHFTGEFEEYKRYLQEHIEFNGEILNHVFFGECSNYFIELIGKERDIPKLKELFNYLELMATSVDDEVKELLSVTILAQIGDSKEILKKSYKYMSSETMKASNEIERFWGRN